MRDPKTMTQYDYGYDQGVADTVFAVVAWIRRADERRIAQRLSGDFSTPLFDDAQLVAAIERGDWKAARTDAGSKQP